MQERKENHRDLFVDVTIYFIIDTWFKSECIIWRAQYVIRFLYRNAKVKLRNRDMIFAL